MDIFNPPLCLTKELKSSWAQNVLTTTDDSKIPIEVAQGIPRLKLQYDPGSKEDWFACAIPLKPDWTPVDISQFTLLKFTLYADDDCGGLVRLEDSNKVESEDFDIETMAVNPGEENALSLSLAALANEKIDLTSISLLKFIGYKDAAFYISEITVE